MVHRHHHLPLLRQSCGPHLLPRPKTQLARPAHPPQPPHSGPLDRRHRLLSASRNPIRHLRRHRRRRDQNRHDGVQADPVRDYAAGRGEDRRGQRRYDYRWIHNDGWVYGDRVVGVQYRLYNSCVCRLRRCLLYEWEGEGAATARGNDCGNVGERRGTCECYAGVLRRVAFHWRWRCVVFSLYSVYVYLCPVAPYLWLGTVTYGNDADMNI